MDMKDGGTWYFLGNAYLSNFFANFKRFDELENSVKAYNEAVLFWLSLGKVFQASVPGLVPEQSQCFGSHGVVRVSHRRFQKGGGDRSNSQGPGQNRQYPEENGVYEDILRTIGTFGLTSG